MGFILHLFLWRPNCLLVKSLNTILSQHHIKGHCNAIGVQKQYTVMAVREVCKEGV